MRLTVFDLTAVSAGILAISACSPADQLSAQTEAAAPSQDLLDSDIESASMDAHPEARPYQESGGAMADVDAALVRAAESGKRVIVVMGANWCHDSRGLAGWFATPRFSNMLGGKYETVYVNVGMPQEGEGRNIEIAQRFGIESQENTPMVLVLSADGTLLNSEEDAKSWRNAASRSEDAIFTYFDGLE
ncbi:thioredoxin family protein [Sphingorhabdus sp. Alg239-R122]|uniref:thioredoxin family protein n=1 Tax=Sphingorhabdus sp. Alg239-R122 TaxID=2305989 RepID=UPI001F087BB1|nr:thioredoxin family protein [Sphingorhabdus sp. Alg239-R122]